MIAIIDYGAGGNLFIVQNTLNYLVFENKITLLFTISCGGEIGSR